jgi:peptidoglycan/xylan/chitin deacetylase (PgdA/CDA1 family)
MQLDRLGSLFVTRPLLGAGLFRPRHAIPILMYHSVSRDAETGLRPYYRLTTSPARFREQMQLLHDGGFTVCDLPEALRRLEPGFHHDERAVVVTFDDGFRDFASHAWPILAEFAFTATVFLPTDFIANSRKSFKNRECLTWQEVRELHVSGVSFGAHTVSHPELYRLPWPDVRSELRDSRLQIEQELQAPVKCFAYPYAFPQEDRRFVSRFREELVDVGYTCAVTTVIGRAHRGSDALCLKRLPINDCDDRPLFVSKLDGAYDWVGGLQGVFRRTKRHARILRSAWNERHPSPVT